MHRLLLLALLLPLVDTAWAVTETRRADDLPGAISTVHPAPGMVTLVIIIDDIGNHRGEGEAAIALPGKLNIAVLPHTPHGAGLAKQAWLAGKEVLLHAPMSALGNNNPGTGELTENLSETEFRATLQQAIAGTPHIRGVNNHMGSALTPLRKQMTWLMAQLAEQQLYFVDSRTNKDTVAAIIAAETGLPHLSRQVFLDNIPERAAIAERFEVLVSRARREGVAVAIGHPYPETIAFLQEILPTLEAQGLRLATVSEVLAQPQLHSL
ncbi:hypothetical protein CWI75_02795 [Kineobactrum sediminis]|uniref:Divergent polysaccharide deacetylase family protein n=1 Tax=Kineobactrum sediminis TaxID=1905677 RepID=A0A2N5Y7C2_9GAMM|nr:divergent polysaccharide deacetylase family protein [Kineobactrum sediminis]PLW84285.1 hypothetical protein CWI75_02795 [Kineobactrum sediminis]